MSYVALYRKFRPNDFKDVKGQEHIVTALKNQIMSNRIGHAYLFSGTRGTGKTTIVKTYAKTFNKKKVEKGDIISDCKLIQKNKMKKVGEEWVETEELEWWLQDYQVEVIGF